jgi:hypothetical protein
MTVTDMLKLAGALVCVTAAAPPAQGAGQMTGVDVLTRMHDRYARKWYPTLTFTQETTRRGREGNMTEETWYESLQFEPATGAWLRIDTGEPTNGNGVLYTADSSWTIRAGKVTGTNNDGNPFIPLIENVYLQPVAVTMKQLEPLKFDMSRVVNVRYDGRPAWAVGAASDSDTLSPQFWIDKDRLVVVRAMLSFTPNRPPFDIHLDNYVETGGGWLATKVTMLSGGVPRQIEEYSGWKTSVRLDRKLFAAATWSTAVHWKK